MDSNLKARGVSQGVFAGNRHAGLARITRRSSDPRCGFAEISYVLKANRMYAPFIADLCRFMLDSRIAGAGDLRGCARPEIAALEEQLGLRLPAAFSEALLAVGESCGELMDGDKFGITGIQEASEVAQDIVTEDDSPWKPSRSMLPFLQHQGYNFQFFYTDEHDDDPAVWAYVETEPGPILMQPSFTCWLRERAIWCVEHTPWNDEVCREIDQHRDVWMERKQILDRYDAEAHRLRGLLLQRVAVADRKRGKITTVLEFQELWNREFRTTELYTTLLKEGKRIPWGWLHGSAG
jgi:hypothetical protein